MRIDPMVERTAKGIIRKRAEPSPAPRNASAGIPESAP
jgi:hypothetical protein